MRKKATNTALGTLVVLSAAVLGMTFSASAQLTAGSNKSTDVNVSITSEVALDVEPKVLQYSNVDVGSQTVKTDRQYKGITIENTGSEYIDRIWANASMPNSRPFGTGKPSQYNAGNFLQIKPNLSQSGISASGAAVSHYYFVNRREFRIPESSVPAYIVAPPSKITFQNGNTVASDADATSGTIYIGRMRRGAQELWWLLATPETDGGGDDCDGTQNTLPILRLANVSSTASRLGTVDFRDRSVSGAPGNWVEYAIGENPNMASYGIASRAVTFKYKNKELSMDVLTKCSGGNTANIVRTRFAVDVLDADDLTTQGYASELILAGGNTASNMLLPGKSLPIKTAVQVPTGVAATSSGNQITQGKLTLFATANQTAQLN
ncbi:MAG: hypothetical protein ABEK10_00540 [Candidatus Nanosalina sp.]